MFLTAIDKSSEALEYVKNYNPSLDSKIMDFDRTLNLEYTIKVLRAEYGEEQWNNEDFPNMVKKITKKDNFITKIFDKVKKHTLKSHKKALPAAHHPSFSTSNKNVEHPNIFANRMGDLVATYAEYLDYDSPGTDFPTHDVYELEDKY